MNIYIGGEAMFIHNKLVRDNIPNIIESQGKVVKYRTLFEKEYLFQLNKKLIEEVEEYKRKNEIVELADILEVVFALGKAQGVSEDELLKIRQDKLETNGGFDGKIFLETVNS